MYARLLTRLQNPMLIQSDKAQVIVKAIVPSLLAGKLLEKPKKVKAEVFGEPESGMRDDSFEVPAGVCLIEVEGTLLHKDMWFASGATSYQYIQNTVLRAAERGTKTICFVLDSPGGEVSGLFELTEALKAYREQYGLNYIGVVDSLAASACYAIAAVCDTLYATTESYILSIGAIRVHVSETAKDEKEGYAYTFIRSKAEKAKGSSHELLEEKTIAKWREGLQKIDETFNMLVTSERGVELSTVLATEGDVMKATEAEKLGFVDHVIPYMDSSLIDFGEHSSETILTTGTNTMTQEKLFTQAEVDYKVDAAVTLATAAHAEALQTAKAEGADEAGKMFALADEMGLPSTMAADQITEGNSLATAKTIFTYAASLQDKGSLINNDQEVDTAKELAGETVGRPSLVGDK